MKKEEIDYLETCEECKGFFEQSEMKEIDGNYYCRDCSNRCAECNSMIDEEISYNKSFCSIECYNIWYHDMCEDEWKLNDNKDEY